MALGKRKSGNDFLPSLKYDARHGRLALQDRVVENGRWETVQQDVTDNFCAVFDLLNLQKGWITFPKGAPPAAVLVPVGAEHDSGEPPTADFKEGLRLLVKMHQTLGGDVREVLSTAVAFWNGIDTLHSDYVAGVTEHNGELPEVIFSGAKEHHTANGTTYIPIFKIVRWVSRPVDLPLAGISMGTPKKSVPPKVTPTTQKPKASALPPWRDPDDDIPF